MKRRSRRHLTQGSARRSRSWLGGAFRSGRRRRSRTTRYEVAAPALKRNVKRQPLPARLISSVLLISMVWLMYWFSSDEAFYVHSLRVSGSERFSEAELMRIGGLDGLHIFWVDTKAVERTLELLPDFASVNVRCGLPADCVINVTERMPLFVWRQGDARIWIGGDGTVLPARGDLPEAIVIDGVGSKALRPGDQLSQDLVTAVEALARLQPDVRAYQYSDLYGLSFRNAHGWLVRLGEGPEIETKLQVLDALTEHLASQGVEPVFLDVRYPAAPYYEE
jgi:cell division septal protein FtsQ